MFDRKEHIETLKLAMPSWSIEKIEQDADIEEKRHSKVRHGDNVLHINHCGPTLTDLDLQEIEETLKAVNFQLSSYDTGGRMMASADDFIIDVFLYLNQVTVKEVILLGLGTNALWDAIKIVIATIYKKVRGRTIHTITSQTATEKTVSFNVVVNIEKDVHLKFLIENIADNEFSEAIDQIRIVSKEREVPDSKIPQVAIYNPEKNIWDFVDYNGSMLKNRSRVIRTLPLEDYIKEVEARERSKP